LRVFLCEKNHQQDDTGSNNSSNVPSQSNAQRLRQQLQMLRIAATIQEVCVFDSRDCQFQYYIKQKVGSPHIVQSPSSLAEMVQ
jgi:transposase-like protein